MALIVSTTISDELRQSFEPSEIKKLLYGTHIAIVSSILVSPIDLTVRKYLLIKDGEKLGEILSIPGDGWFLISSSVLGYFTGMVLDSSHLRVGFLRASLNLAVTSFVVQLLKLCGRVRPYVSPQDQWRFDPLGLQDWRRSFPSGHAQASAAFYSSISRMCEGTRACKYTLLLIPLLVSFGRLLTDHHWLSDTVGGLIIGGSLEFF